MKCAKIPNISLDLDPFDSPLVVGQGQEPALSGYYRYRPSWRRTIEAWQLQGGVARAWSDRTCKVSAGGQDCGRGVRDVEDE